MRHELQTPVTAISDYIEMLYEDAAESGANEVLAAMTRIRTAARILYDKVDQLLNSDLSRAFFAAEAIDDAQDRIRDGLLTPVTEVADILEGALDDLEPGSDDSRREDLTHQLI